MKRIVRALAVSSVCALGSVGAAPIPAGETLTEARATQREEQDLSAQQDMAYYAKVMFYATLASAVIGFAGLGGLLLSLKHTRSALRQAQEGHALAERQVFNDQRPWLLVDSLQVRARSYEEIEGEDRHKMELVVRIKNIGKMPAQDINHTLLHRIHVEDLLDLERALAELNPNMNRYRGLVTVLAPGESREFVEEIEFSVPSDLDDIGLELEVGIKYAADGHKEQLETHYKASIGYGLGPLMDRFLFNNMGAQLEPMDDFHYRLA